MLAVTAAKPGSKALLPLLASCSAQPTQLLASWQSRRSLRWVLTHQGAQARASCSSTVSSSTGARGLYLTTYLTYSRLSSRPSRPEAISSTRPAGERIKSAGTPGCDAKHDASGVPVYQLAAAGPLMLACKQRGRLPHPKTAALTAHTIPIIVTRARCPAVHAWVLVPASVSATFLATLASTAWRVVMGRSVKSRIHWKACRTPQRQHSSMKDSSMQDWTGHFSQATQRAALMQAGRGPANCVHLQQTTQAAVPNMLAANLARPASLAGWVYHQLRAQI